MPVVRMMEAQRFFKRIFKASDPFSIRELAFLYHPHQEINRAEKNCDYAKRFAFGKESGQAKNQGDNADPYRHKEKPDNPK